MSKTLRNLVIILGDQLDRQSLVFDDFDPEQDAIWMCEASGEATHVWSAKPRVAIFLAAMRHFRDELRARGFTVIYRELDKNAIKHVLETWRFHPAIHQGVAIPAMALVPVNYKIDR